MKAAKALLFIFFAYCYGSCIWCWLTYGEAGVNWIIEPDDLLYFGRNFPGLLWYTFAYLGLGLVGLKAIFISVKFLTQKAKVYADRYAVILRKNNVTNSL